MAVREVLGNGPGGFFNPRNFSFGEAMVLSDLEEALMALDGIEGVIINQEKGAGGFGYDPLFVPEGHCETFAQLGTDVKNALSHRARALAGLLAWSGLND